MTLYQKFIPQIFDKYQGTKQANFKLWVTKYVNTEVNKLSSVFIKTDGSNKPYTDIDFNKNTITNIRESSEETGPVIKKELNYVYDVINPLYNKSYTPLALNTAKVSTSSGHSSSYGSAHNLTDGDPVSQWIISKPDVNKYVWVLLDIPVPIQIYRCDLLPRPGKQQSTHVLTHYYLEGSSDGSSYYKIFESSLMVDQNRQFEFDITRPFKYYRLTCTGKQQFDLSDIKFYEARQMVGWKGDQGQKWEKGDRGIDGFGHGIVFVSYAVENLQKRDKIVGKVLYNAWGTYIDGDLVFYKDGMTRYLIGVRRTSFKGEISFRVLYIERGARKNFIDVTLKDGHSELTIMNFIDVKADGILRILADSRIKELIVSLEILQY